VEDVVAEGGAGGGFDVEGKPRGGDRGNGSGGGAGGKNDGGGSVKVFAQEFGGEAEAAGCGLGEYGGRNRSTVDDGVSGEQETGE
jgi:hypothetical protein